MIEIIGVKFRGEGRTYSFSPAGSKFKTGDTAIVETAQGVEAGTVCRANYFADESEISKPLKDIKRKATKADLERLAANREKEKTAYEICKKKIAEHGLEMKLINAEASFENNKITFNFTADARIDFRTLVKDLAATFKARIELRQIGVRDESRKLGGYGLCGQPFCCRRFLNSFHPVSIKMAKEQGLSLNPEKISGCCGRLMCCLKYEQNSYEYLNKITPKVGSVVSTPSGNGTVVDTAVMTGKLKVRLDEDQMPIEVSRDEAEVISTPQKSKKNKQ